MGAAILSFLFSYVLSFLVLGSFLSAPVAALCVRNAAADCYFLSCAVLPPTLSSVHVAYNFQGLSGTDICYLGRTSEPYPGLSPSSRQFSGAPWFWLFHCRSRPENR